MMNPSHINIDFLSGLGSSPDIATPDKKAGVENGGPMFAEMLNDLLMLYPGAIDRPVVDGVKPEVIPSPADESAMSNVPTADSMEIVNDENVLAFNNDIRAQLPEMAFSIKNTDIRMNVAVPVNLEAGNYEVIESHHSDGTLKLKLADPATRDGLIQVEIPTEQLFSNIIGSKNEQSELPASVKRVDLDAVPKQTKSIEHLFSQLNLKQIEVSKVALDNDPVHTQLALKLKSTLNNANVELRTQLPPDQLNTLKIEPQLSPEAKADGQKQLVAASAEATKPHQVGLSTAPLFVSVPAQKIRNAGRQLRSGSANLDGDPGSSLSSTPDVSITAENDQLLNTFGQSLKQVLSVTNKIVGSVVKQTTSDFDVLSFHDEIGPSGLIANIDGVGDTNKTVPGKLSPRTVRFSLPDDLASKLKPNGQSVMIRIEPDHIGPARLSLKMHHDKLSARITVKTVGIKAVVEHSLDRLTQQLVKSGIDIEHIEVALDGRQFGDQLSERHPQWQRQPGPTHFDENILAETNEVSPISPLSTAAPAYVGGGGVNVLA